MYTCAFTYCTGRHICTKHTLWNIFTWIHTYTHPFRYMFNYTNFLYTQAHRLTHIYNWIHTYKQSHEIFHKSVYKTISQICIFLCSPYPLLLTKVHVREWLNHTFIKWVQGIIYIFRNLMIPLEPTFQKSLSELF